MTVTEACESDANLASALIIAPQLESSTAGYSNRVNPSTLGYRNAVVVSSLSDFKTYDGCNIPAISLD